MTDRLQIVIEGRNGAKQVFADVSRDAESMGRTVEQSGQRAGRSMEDLKRNATAVGGAIGTVAGAFSLAGQASIEHNRQVDALTRVYGDASREMLDFSRALQDNTNFSDDQARQAALTASTLQKSYGLTTDAVEQLIRRSADLAQVHGITLTDAITRTSAGVRGEAESVELLSITLSDNFVAAEAAARGMTGWRTTMTDAEKAAFRYTLLMEQSADVTGAAADAAAGARGEMIDLRDRVQDATVAFGNFLGPLGESMSVLGSMALLLPVVGGSLGRLTAGLGAAGLRPGMLGPLALLAGGGALAYGYGQDTEVTTTTNTAVNKFFIQMSELMNAILPGSPYDTKRYYDQMDENAQVDVINQLFRTQAESQDATFEQVGQLLGLGYFIQSPNRGKPGDTSPDIYVAPTKEEILAAVEAGSRAAGVTADVYLMQQARAQGQVYDPTTQTFMPREQYLAESSARATSYVGAPGTSGLQGAVPVRTGPSTRPDLYADTESGRRRASFASDYQEHAAITMATMGRESAQPGVDIQALRLYRQELEATYGAYAGMVEGLNNASDATRAFHAAQGEVLTQQTVYTQQIGEYSQQQNALTSAYDILIERQNQGIALTKEEQALIDNYPELYGRVTGGVEDATVAAGLLAAAYIENMKVGDEMNRNLADSTSATGDLVGAIELLIMSLDGVPEDVKVQLAINGLPEAMGNIDSFIAYLNSVPREVVTYLTTYQNLDYVPGSATSPFMHGGVVGYADGGVIARMAEAGPELVYRRDGGVGVAMTPGLYAADRGDYVSPAPASRAALAKSGGLTIQIMAPIYVTADNAGDFADQLMAHSVGNWRSP